MRRAWWVTAWVLAVAGIAAAGGGEAPYRLSGTAVISGGRSVAIVTLAGGESILIREGDAFDGGEVAAISEEWITLRSPDGERRIWLAGGEKTPAPPEEASSAAVLKREARADHVVVEVDAHSLAQEVAQSRQAPPGPGRDPEHGPGEVLVSLLGLPRGSAVTEVNETPLAGLPDPLAMVQKSLEEKRMVRLNLAERPEGGARRVYVIPRQAEENP